MVKQLKTISEKELRKKIQKYKDIFAIPRRYNVPEQIMEQVAKEIAHNVAENRFYYGWQKEQQWWDAIAIHQQLSEELMINKKSKFEWSLIFRYQNLSEQFMFDNAHRTKYFWECLSSNQHLTEEFIERFSEKLNWGIIFERFNCSEEFVVKHQDKINWSTLLKNPHLSKQFFERNKDLITKKIYAKDWVSILEFQDVSEETIKGIKKGKMVWRAISAYCNISKKFLLSNYRNIHARELIWRNSRVSQEVKDEVKMIETLSGSKI